MLTVCSARRAGVPKAEALTPSAERLAAFAKDKAYDFNDFGGREGASQRTKLRVCLVLANARAAINRCKPSAS